MTTNPPPPPGEAARERTAYHEAGHSVVACRVGHRLGPVTVRPGVTFGGCSWSRPPKLRESDLDAATQLAAPLLPARVRRRCETEILVCLAGGLAEEVLWYAGRPGRRPPSIGERVTEQLGDRRERPASRAELAQVARAAAESAPAPSDAETVAVMAELLDYDDPVAARLHVEWLSAVCRTMLADNSRTVERVAAALLTAPDGTLGATALRRIINPGRENS